jgi:hypothetical protein
MPEGAERPAAIRCGCFLPDLTKLANANAHPTPAAPYGECFGISQAAVFSLPFRGEIRHLISLPVGEIRYLISLPVGEIRYLISLPVGEIRGLAAMLLSRSCEGAA